MGLRPRPNPFGPSGLVSRHMSDGGASGGYGVFGCRVFAGASFREGAGLARTGDRPSPRGLRWSFAVPRGYGASDQERRRAGGRELHEDVGLGGWRTVGGRVGGRPSGRALGTEVCFCVGANGWRGRRGQPLFFRPTRTGLLVPARGGLERLESVNPRRSLGCSYRI